MGLIIRTLSVYIFNEWTPLNKFPLLVFSRVTDEFRFCCLARNSSSVCLPPPDEFSSCEDLMSNLVLRLCVWLLAGVATVGNVLVIVWRTRYSHCNQVSAPNTSPRATRHSTRQLVLALVSRTCCMWRKKKQRHWLCQK